MCGGVCTSNTTYKVSNNQPQTGLNVKALSLSYIIYGNVDKSGSVDLDETFYKSGYWIPVYNHLPLLMCYQETTNRGKLLLLCAENMKLLRALTSKIDSSYNVMELTSTNHESISLVDVNGVSLYGKEMSSYPNILSSNNLQYKIFYSVKLRDRILLYTSNLVIDLLKVYTGKQLSELT